LNLKIIAIQCGRSLKHLSTGKRKINIQCPTCKKRGVSIVSICSNSILKCKSCESSFTWIQGFKTFILSTPMNILELVQSLVRRLKKRRSENKILFQKENMPMDDIYVNSYDIPAMSDQTEFKETKTKKTTRIECGVCGEPYIVPTNRGKLKIKCRKCGEAFDWSPQVGIFTKPIKTQTRVKTQPKPFTESKKIKRYSVSKKIQCPKCFKGLKIPPETGRIIVKCPNCRKSFHHGIENIKYAGLEDKLRSSKSRTSRYFSTNTQRRKAYVDMQDRALLYSQKRKFENNYNATSVIIFDKLDCPFSLDLHGFKANPARVIIKDFVEAMKIHRVPVYRIIHGKGKVLFKIVPHELERLGESFTLCDGFVDINYDQGDLLNWQSYSKWKELNHLN
jgi:ribosomal protein L37AE/L43A